MEGLLKAGLHPKASDALRQLQIPAWRIGQTVGHAKASAGTHEPDGTVTIDGKSVAYCAATDFMIRDLSKEQLRGFLLRLGAGGFAAWARIPGADHWPLADALHVHGVFAGVTMKRALRNQIHDYCHGKNGLASHAPYGFFPPSSSMIAVVRGLFLASGNPITDAAG